MIFQSWLQEELNLTQVRIPIACCFSTVGLDNYHNARFVSLKEVSDDSFVITEPLNSRKGLEINLCKK
jgi:pyridoxamine 5'-phosphate oxidase